MTMSSQRYPGGSPELIRSPWFSARTQSQMLSKDQKRSEAQAQARHDEARLLGGNYGYTDRPVVEPGFR